MRTHFTTILHWQTAARNFGCRMKCSTFISVLNSAIKLNESSMHQRASDICSVEYVLICEDMCSSCVVCFSNALTLVLHTSCLLHPLAIGCCPCQWPNFFKHSSQPPVLECRIGRNVDSVALKCSLWIACWYMFWVHEWKWQFFMTAVLGLWCCAGTEKRLRKKLQQRDAAITSGCRLT